MKAPTIEKTQTPGVWRVRAGNINALIVQSNIAVTLGIEPTQQEAIDAIEAATQ